jgi:hypothetical protein
MYRDLLTITHEQSCLHNKRLPFKKRTVMVVESLDMQFELVIGFLEHYSF